MLKNSYSKEEPSDEGSGEEIAEKSKKNLMMDLTFQKNSASNSKKETLTDSKNTYNGPKSY